MVAIATILAGAGPYTDAFPTSQLLINLVWSVALVGATAWVGRRPSAPPIDVGSLMWFPFVSAALCIVWFVQLMTAAHDARSATVHLQLFVVEAYATIIGFAIIAGLTVFKTSK